MPEREEDKFVDEMLSRGKVVSDVRWSLLRKKYPNWDVEYIRSKLWGQYPTGPKAGLQPKRTLPERAGRAIGVVAEKAGFPPLSVMKERISATELRTPLVLENIAQMIGGAVTPSEKEGFVPEKGGLFPVGQLYTAPALTTGVRGAPPAGIPKLLLGERELREPPGLGKIPPSKWENWLDKLFQKAKKKLEPGESIPLNIAKGMARITIAIPELAEVYTESLAHDEPPWKVPLQVLGGMAKVEENLLWLVGYNLTPVRSASMDEEYKRRFAQLKADPTAPFWVAIMGRAGVKVLAKNYTKAKGYLKPTRMVEAVVEETVGAIPAEKILEAGQTLRNKLEPFERQAIKKGLQKQRGQTMAMRKRVKAIERERAGAEEIGGEGFVLKPERKLLESRLQQRLRGVEGMEIPPLGERPTFPRLKGRGLKEPVPGEAELRLARELKAKGVTEKPAVKKLMTVEELPDWARRSIYEEAKEMRTIDRPDYYAGSLWRRETVNVKSFSEYESIRAGKYFKYRGAKTKGPMVVDARQTILDGHNRLHEAIKRGDETIEVFQEVKKPKLPVTEKPTIELPTPELQGEIAGIRELGKPKKRVLTRKPKPEIPLEDSEVELYAGLPIKRIVPKIAQRAIEGLFHQARNRVKHPLAKQTIDEAYDVYGKQGRLRGTWEEKARQGRLQKLETSDAELITDYLENPTKVKISRELEGAAEVVKEIFDDVFREAERIGVKVKEKDVWRAIRKVKNYVPRRMKGEIAREIWDDIGGAWREALKVAEATKLDKDIAFANIVKDKYRNAQFNPRVMQSIGHLIKTKQAKTPAEAVAMLDQHSFNDLFIPFGNIERARIVDLPFEFWERDIRKIIGSYMYGAAKRLPEIEKWGQDQKVITKRLSQISREGNIEESARLRRIVQSFTGALEKTERISKDWRRFQEVFTSLEVGTKIGLGTATIPQFTQPTISFIPLTRIVDWTRAGFDMFSKSHRQWARETGAPGIQQIRLFTGMRQRGLSGKFAEITTTGSLFQGVNRTLQYWSSLTARRHLSHLHKLAQSKNKIQRSYARRNLKDWGLDPDKPLTENVLKEGSYRFAMDTQLQRNVLKEPMWMNDPRFRMFALFKRFGYRQFNLFKDHMWREVKHGNPLPLLKLAAGGYLGGEFVIWAKNEVRKFLTGRPYYRHETEMWHRFINNMASVGTLGWITDVGRFDEADFTAMLKDAYRTAGFQLTPVVVSDIVKATKLGKRFVDDLDNRGFDAAVRRTLPYVAGLGGGVLVNYWKERFKTQIQFDNTMEFFKREVRRRALKELLKGNYEQGFEIINKWNGHQNTPQYMLEIPDWTDIDRFREQEEKKRIEY